MNWLQPVSSWSLLRIYRYVINTEKVKVLVIICHKGTEKAYSFLNLGAPASLPPGKSPVTHSIEGWVRLRACMSECGQLAPIGVRTSNRPSHSETLPTGLCDQLVTKIMESV